MQTITTFDGSIIPGTISGQTVHTWNADANGLFQATTDLGSEWKANYATMLAGHGDSLTALQRMEGNAEAVIDNTGAVRLPGTYQALLRSDLQREYDAIDAAMRMNQVIYGTNPSAQFNADTYLQMEKTLQGNESLETLAVQGHGLNKPASFAYDGYTTDFQNRTDGKTFYVGGGLDNGQNAIAAFLDDVVLSHAPFTVVMHNGVLTQVNQNGNLESTLSDAVTAFNQTAFTRVFVASDFSAVSTTIGDVVYVSNPVAAPPLPVPAVPLSGVTALDGTILPETISGLTAHTWTADSTGLYVTLADLGTEWKANYATMLAGHGDTLTALQRMEGNAEAVIDNTAATKLTSTRQAMLRSDLQREFDAIDASMRTNQTTYGINPSVAFTAYSYQKMEETLQGEETLKELGYQGHGVNSPPSTKYSGFTNNFQNRVDGKTYYVGGGPGNGALAIANFLDDDVLTHAPFQIVQHNGIATQLNQNGNLESPLLTDALIAGNATAFGRVYVASDFSTNSAAVGAVVNVTYRPSLDQQTGDVMVAEGQAVSFALSASTFTDPLGSAVTYSALKPDGTPLPSWLSFDPTSRVFSGTAPGSVSSQSVMVVGKSDGGQATAEAFHVYTTPGIPTLLSQTGDQRIGGGQAFSFTLPASSFSNPTSSSLTITASSSDGSPLPSWINFSSLTNTFTGDTPVAGASAAIMVVATTVDGAQAAEGFHVYAAGTQPLLVHQTSDASYDYGQSISFKIPTGTFTDPSGGALALSAKQVGGAALPSWLSFDGVSGTFAGMAPASLTGTSPTTAAVQGVEVDATNTAGMVSGEAFHLYLNPGPPKFLQQTPDERLTVAKPFSFAINPNTFSDPAGGPISYSAFQTGGAPLPSWIGFNTTTDTFSGITPQTAGGSQ